MSCDETEQDMVRNAKKHSLEEHGMIAPNSEA